ncbi:arylsulfatase A precursor [Lentisphaera araneosa HTCC2155]|uniref:Arylsulfatase A n=1 Tax=Lentisphaera araneosa HTCC2155 TaxID=313628 RepID=A6DI18_9BACT|nr:arylsulfatase [Lentisphaera araneosa]EDM28672.1 arylsulfatase A precursor [Lentisphaera araneosa HTCC2155]
MKNWPVSKMTSLKKISFLASFVCSLVSAAEKPNIIYLLADDMGVGDVKAYNADSKIPTPALDNLAANGMMFTDAHTNSSVCTPTRYGILTGRYSWRTTKKSGVTQGLSPHLIDSNRETVASLLKKEGYATACIGKWHLGMDWSLKDGSIADSKSDQSQIDLSKEIQNGPNKNGFDYYFGMAASANHSPHCFIEDGYTVGKLQVLDDKQRKAVGIDGKPGLVAKGFKQSEILPRFTEKTCEWVRSQVNQKPDQPFFVYMPLNSPHSPIVPSAKFLGKSGLSSHGDFCMETDWALGEVVKILKALGIEDNTMIIFTADNGTSPMAKFEPMQEQGHFPSYIYRGLKGETYEGGHRVPFIVKWPKGLAPAKTSDQLICTTDLMATVAEINGIALANNVGEDSISFLPALREQAIPELANRAIVHHSDAGVFAIRQGKWKLLLDNIGGSRRSNPKDKPVIDDAEIQLFDMVNDPQESTNLSQKNPEIVEGLKKQLADYINKGRSNVGTPVSNDSMETKKTWAQLWPLKDYLNEATLAQVGNKPPKKIQQLAKKDKKSASDKKVKRIK